MSLQNRDTGQGPDVGSSLVKIKVVLIHRQLQFEFFMEDK